MELFGIANSPDFHLQKSQQSFMNGWSSLEFSDDEVEKFDGIS